CRSARNLDLHHIEYRSNGGCNEMWNITTLCSAHHKSHHEGLLSIHGKAPHDLEFTWTAPSSKPVNAAIDPASPLTSSRPVVHHRPASPVVSLRPDRAPAPALISSAPFSDRYAAPPLVSEPASRVANPRQVSEPARKLPLVSTGINAARPPASCSGAIDVTRQRVNFKPLIIREAAE